MHGYKTYDDDDYIPSVELAYWKVPPYWAEVSTLGRWPNEDIAYLVEVFHKGTRVHYATFDTEDKAAAMFHEWTENKLPVQIAMEAHGLAGPLKPIKTERYHDAEL